MFSRISKIRPCVTPCTSAKLRKATGVSSITATKASQELQEINHYALNLYAQEKERVGTQLGKKIPVILANQDHLSSMYQGAKRRVKYIPEKYHQLKALAHIPIAVHITHAMQNPQESDRLFSKLEDFLKLIKTTPTLHKHSDFLQKNLRLIRCQQKELFAQELSSFEKPLHALIDEAARIRLAALHTEVQKIQNTIDPEDWSRLCVVVMGPPMPREGELSMQYFEKILKTSISVTKCPYARALTSTAHLYGKQRLIYAESICEENRALDLIATHICDEALGRALLNDGSAMRADLLKNAAKKHLGEMFKD